MSVIQPRFFWLVLGAALFLQGCAFQQLKVNNVARELAYGSPEVALAALSKIKPPKRDEAQYLLNRGMLRYLSGDYPGSREDLQSAKSIIESLEALSVSENLAAGSINETLRSYTASPAERVLLHQVLALGYLAEGDLDGARVEMLQMDVAIKDEAGSDEDDLNGQLASARFISGVVYELGREWDNAMIAYRKAAAIMQARKHPLPRALQDSLLLMSQRVGLRNEYEQYREEFGRAAPKLDPEQGQLIVFYWQGVVSQKLQNFSAVFSPALQHHLSLALPYYPPKPVMPESTVVSVAGSPVSTALLEDVEKLVREDLSAEMPAITAMALARMVAKHKGIKKAQEQSPIAGLIANFASTLSEVADVRSWNTLPANIQVARLSLPAGEHTFRIGQGSIAFGGNVASDTVSIHAGKLSVLTAHSVGGHVIKYTAAGRK